MKHAPLLATLLGGPLPLVFIAGLQVDSLARIFAAIVVTTLVLLVGMVIGVFLARWFYFKR